jgi:hypothetical protein
VSGQIDYRPKDLLGYWFQSGHGLVEPGEEPQEIDITAFPAGAIAGQVLNVDGTPAADNVSVGIQGVLRTKTFTQAGGFDQNIKVDGQGRYFINPLPLAGSYVVTAARGHTIQWSPVALNDAQPTNNVTLQLPRTTAVEGTIVDPQGRPLPQFAFSLAFSGPPIEKVRHSWGNSWEEYADYNGHFRFDDLSVDVGQYALEIRPRRDFCALRVPLPRAGKPVTVQLQRGLVIEGQLLDNDTNLPVQGAELFAMTTDALPGNAALCEAEGLTDAEGRFRFSNLEDRSYGINNRSFGGMEFPPDQTWKPGKNPIVLRVPVPEGSSFKPQKKKGGTP